MVLNIILLIIAAIAGMAVGFEINEKELQDYIKTNNELVNELIQTRFERDANEKFMNDYIRAYEDQLRFNRICEAECKTQKRVIKKLEKKLKGKNKNET